MTLTRRSTRHVEVTVLTGLSGAGRSEAAKALEDLGWFVIDNLPPALIIDARGGTFFNEAVAELDKVRRDVANYRLVFFEATDDALVRRFDATRRRHPLATEDRVEVGIQRERQLMARFREGADLIVDTSDLSVRELRAKLAAFFDSDGSAEGLKTTVISFGFKHGLPLDADIVLDVRFLPNPHWVEGLRQLTGEDEPVREYVYGHDVTQSFLARTRDLFAVLLPGYQDEGRHYLTIALGCTGGRHRSVALADELGAFIKDKGFSVKVIHRDVARSTSTP